MPSLYDLTGRKLELFDALMEGEGEIDEQLEALFDEVIGLEAQKIEGYIQIIAELKMQEEGAAAERKRFEKKERAAKNAQDRLKERIKQHFLMTDTTQVETDLGKVKLQNNGGKLPLDVGEKYLNKPTLLPKELRRIRVEADTDTIREHLEMVAEERARIEASDMPPNLKADELKAIDERYPAVKYARLLPRGKHIRIY